MWVGRQRPSDLRKLKRPGLLKSSKHPDTSADSFVPLLIYVVLQANLEHLVSNVQYILRFRNQEKLGGEVGYYMSSLMGAVQFIETLDRTALSVSDEDFERNVEAAVSAMAEREPGTTHHGESKEQPEPLAPDQKMPLKKDSASIDVGSRPKLSPVSGVRPPEKNIRPPEKDDPGSGIFQSLSNIGRIFSDDHRPLSKDSTQVQANASVPGQAQSQSWPRSDEDASGRALGTISSVAQTSSQGTVDGFMHSSDGTSVAPSSRAISGGQDDVTE